MSTPSDLDTLIELMAKLPGLGPRSARRAVLHLVKKRAFLYTPADARKYQSDEANEATSFLSTPLLLSKPAWADSGRIRSSAT